MLNLDYNTQLPNVILKEYGRNIQKLVAYIVKIEDREERNRFAYNLIELMRQINPNTRDSQDTQNKLWDDLYIMSRFSLDVDSPYPMPEKESIGKKPKPMAYTTHEISFRHYGRNVELLIARIFETEDQEEHYDGLVKIGKLMKSLYLTWNKDSVQDEIILKHMEKLANRDIDPELRERLVKENALELARKERKNIPTPKINKKKRKGK
jgi:hypothetical protein